MGQCGCRDFHPNFALPGPDGSVYCLQIDPGCPDCDAHQTGLVVQKLSGDEVRDWDANHLPVLELKPVDGADFQERTILIVDPEHITNSLVEYVGAAYGAWDGDKEGLRDAVREALRGAVFKSRQDAEKDDHLA